MFELRDLFQWERFITQSVIKLFYWLAIIISLLIAVSGIASGVAQLVVSPIASLISIVLSVLGALVGIIFARIAAEFVLIVFRINEHLGAIRNQRGM